MSIIDIYPSCADVYVYSMLITPLELLGPVLIKLWQN